MDRTSIERVEGPACVLRGDDIDTDRIIPARFMKVVTYDAVGEHVFEDGDLRVRVVGMPYKQDRSLKDLRAIKKQDGDAALIALVHALAGEKPPDHIEDFFGEPVFRYDRLIAKNGPDCWCFGHWHQDQGIVEVEGWGWMIGFRDPDGIQLELFALSR